MTKLLWIFLPVGWTMVEYSVWYDVIFPANHLPALDPNRATPRGKQLLLRFPPKFWCDGQMRAPALGGLSSCMEDL